jgi:hypothetical protein
LSALSALPPLPCVLFAWKPFTCEAILRLVLAAVASDAVVGTTSRFLTANEMVAGMLSRHPAVALDLLKMVPLQSMFWKQQQHKGVIIDCQNWFSDNLLTFSMRDANREGAVRLRPVLTLEPSGIGKTRMLHEVTRLMILAGRPEDYAMLLLLITRNGMNGALEPDQSRSVSSQLA